LQIVVEKRLNSFLREFQEGRREGSVVTTQTADSLSSHSKETWRAIRKELEEIGITVAAFDLNRDFIIEWFKRAIATGAFEEQTINESSSQTSGDLREAFEDSTLPTPDQTITRDAIALGVISEDTASRALVLRETRITSLDSAKRRFSSLSLRISKFLLFGSTGCKYQTSNDAERRHTTAVF
jgi:hypothetical protein